MRTPAGVECAHYYEDHHRGRDVATCRIPRSLRSAPWAPQQCSRCPVPGILLANGSPYLDLELTVRRGFFGIGPGISVRARCLRHGSSVVDAHVGCERCAAEMLDDVGLGDLEEPDV